MIYLSEETEALAKRLAAAQQLSVEAAIERALEGQVRVGGIEPQPVPARRMTVAQMLAFGAEIAALPLLDHRSPNEIMEAMNVV